VFRILIADDDPAFAHLLRLMLTNDSRGCEVDWVKDGLEALDFLRGRPPNLILMDVNMPRMDGIEALRVIKNDAALAVIPVIMLSTSATSGEVRRIYEAHANGFVHKTANLDRCAEFVKAITSFWMDFAVFPTDDAWPRLDRGSSLALPLREVSGHAMSRNDSGLRCEEHYRLMQEFAGAVKDLLDLHEQQFRAIVEGDLECSRFDLLIHMANEQKQQAKYAYLRHVESHGCSNLNVITHASGT
jgi:CheY-like chemotaxis protein